MDNISEITSYRLTAVLFQKAANKLISTSSVTECGRIKPITDAIPLVYLISHAIELYLKCALLKRGAQESDLREFDKRHNLEALLSDLLKLNVSISEDSQAMIRILSEQHKKHSIRYTVFVDDGEATSIPNLHMIDKVLTELLLITKVRTH